MVKSPRCAETTHRSKAPLRLKALYTYSVGTVAGIWDLKYLDLTRSIPRMYYECTLTVLGAYLDRITSVP